MLEEEKVRHVANLAKIELNDDEIKKYQKDLKIMIDEIDKIREYNLDSEIMYTSSENNSVLREDVKGEMLSSEEVFKNVKDKNGNFIEVAVMINE